MYIFLAELLLIRGAQCGLCACTWPAWASGCGSDGGDEAQRLCRRSAYSTRLFELGEVAGEEEVEPVSSGESRGPCGLCGKIVTTDDDRSQNPDGIYFHDRCMAATPDLGEPVSFTEGARVTILKGGPATSRGWPRRPSSPVRRRASHPARGGPGPSRPPAA